MKKLLLLSFIFSFVLSFVNAQDYHFPVKDDGSCVIIQKIDNSKTQDQNYQIVKKWMNNLGNTNKSIIKDETNKNVEIAMAFNTQVSFNPFAGTSATAIGFNASFECKDNSVTYTISNIQMTKAYAGWGSNSNTNPISVIINKIEQAKKDKAAAEENENLSKKERKGIVKDSEDVIEDFTESLDKSWTELENRMGELRDQLK